MKNLALKTRKLQEDYQAAHSRMKLKHKEYFQHKDKLENQLKKLLEKKYRGTLRRLYFEFTDKGIYCDVQMRLANYLYDDHEHTFPYSKFKS